MLTDSIICFLLALLIILPISALITTIYSYQNRKSLVLRDLGGAALVLSAAFLILGLILYVLDWFVHGARADNFVPVIGNDFWGAVLIGYIVSVSILMLYAPRHNPGLRWVNIAGLSYVLIFVFLQTGTSSGRISVPEAWSKLFANYGTVILWAGGLFAIVYAKYTLDFIKERNRLAYLTVIIALIFAQVFPMLYARRDLQRRLSNLSRFELGDQYPQDTSTHSGNVEVR